MVNQTLSNDLWCNTKPIAITSGTVAVNGDFNYIIEELGLKSLEKHRVITYRKKSPFNYNDHCLVYLSNQTVNPYNEETIYIESISTEIIRLISASHGHALVLFTSYRTLKKVYQSVLNKNSHFNLIEMSRGNTGALDAFIKDQNSVLFATGSFWEGINIKGDTLSHVIIVKLPFEIPSPILEHKKSKYTDINTYISSVLIPKMVIKLRQGMGRLIRCETDSGVISILYDRINTNRYYHQVVLGALPQCQITNRVGEIEGFLQDKKPVEYFE